MSQSRPVNHPKRISSAADVDGCLAAYGRRELPLLALGRLPAWTQGVSGDEAPKGGTAADEISGTRLVCALGEDRLVAAAAETLAFWTGRSFARIDGSRTDVASMLTQEALSSCCFVGAPLSDGRGIAPAHWLMDLICEARQAWEAAERRGDPGMVRWGVIAAPDLASFTAVIAKAAHAREISRSYHDAPIYLSPRTGAPWDQSTDPRDGVAWAHHFDMAKVRVISSREWRGSRQCIGSPMDWLMIEGHGRSYCLNEGMACGGRRLTDAPEAAERSCLGTLDCVSERHLRIDPRQYDARVVVLDCCEGAVAVGYPWQAGFEGVACRFLAGTTSAVISSDLMIVRPDQEIVDVLLHAIHCRTLGEFVVRLNCLRRPANPPMPYFLIGDPETPSFACTPPWTSSLASISAFDDVIPLPEADRVRAIQLTFPASSARQPMRCEFLDGQGQAFPAARTSIVRAPTGRHLVALVPRDCDARHAVLDRSDFRSIFEVRDQDDAHPTVELCVGHAAWQDFKSQAAILMANQAMEAPEAGSQIAQLSARTLTAIISAAWPYSAAHDLWRGNMVSSSLGETCPLCGNSDGFRRTYKSGGELRFRKECHTCKITEDSPLVATARLQLMAPREFPAGDEDIIVSIEAVSQAALGAVTAFVSQNGHGIGIRPDFAAACLQQGDKDAIKFRPHCEAQPNPAQIYFVRAVALLNGQFYWASAPVVVKRTG
jgi:hypothetical protein